MAHPQNPPNHPLPSILLCCFNHPGKTRRQQHHAIIQVVQAAISPAVGRAFKAHANPKRLISPAWDWIFIAWASEGKINSDPARAAVSSDLAAAFREVVGNRTPSTTHPLKTKPVRQTGLFVEPCVVHVCF